MRQVVISGLDYMTVKLQQGSALQRLHFQSWTDTAAGFQSNRTWWQSRSTIRCRFLLQLSTWPTSHSLNTAEQTDNSATDQGKKGRSRMDEVQFGRIWEDSRKLISLWVPHKHKTARETAERRERRTTEHLPTLAVEWLSCRGNFEEDANGESGPDSNTKYREFCSLQFVE